MITCYRLSADELVAQPLSPGDPLPADLLWVDLLDPSEAEERYLEQALAMDIPPGKKSPRSRNPRDSIRPTRPCT
nr:hypothetical protein [Pseudomonas oryzihabitans]